MEGATTLLKKHHLKVTPQRQKIVSVLNQCGHLNIEELYTGIKKDFPSVSLATIYKNITQMVDSDLVQEVKIPEKKSVYELSKAPHAHLVCSNCGEIVDMDVDEAMVHRCFPDTGKFQVEKTHLFLEGICPKCQHGK